MFSELWILVAAVLVFIGLVASQGLFIVVGSLVIVITPGGAPVGQVRLSPGGAWPGYRKGPGVHPADTLEYTVTLSNDKPLPLIWIDLLDHFTPNGLELPGAHLRGQRAGVQPAA